MGFPTRGRGSQQKGGGVPNRGKCFNQRGFKLDGFKLFSNQRQGLQTTRGSNQSGSNQRSEFQEEGGVPNKGRRVSTRGFKLDEWFKLEVGVPNYQLGLQLEVGGSNWIWFHLLKEGDSSQREVVSLNQMEEGSNQTGFNQMEGSNQRGFNQMVGYNQTGFNQMEGSNQTGFNQMEGYNQRGFNQMEVYNQRGFNQMEVTTREGSTRWRVTTREGSTRWNGSNQRVLTRSGLPSRGGFKLYGVVQTRGKGSNQIGFQLEGNRF